jgi:hypothetical protein
MTNVITEKIRFLKLRHAYEICPNQECQRCLVVHLPNMAKSKRALGEAYFSSEHTIFFPNSVKAFTDALNWASIWKEKSDSAAQKIERLGKISYLK